MTVEYWVGAEQFYEFWVFALIVLIVLCAVTAIFITTYSKKQNRNKILLLPLTLAILFMVAGFLGHRRYQPYLEQAPHINALIRDRQPTAFGYTYYGSVEKTYYQQLNDLSALQHLVLYEEEPVIEPLEYLGEGPFFHYFQQEDGEKFKLSRHFEFTEDAEQAQLIGSQFVLKDPAFQDIGFKNPEKTMFVTLKIPAEEQGKSYAPENEAQIPKIEDHFRRWNF